MIKHIVLFQLKTEHKDKSLMILQALQDMERKIPQIQKLHAGSDFIQSERSYDIALIVDLENKEALKIYNDHPEHQPVKDLIGLYRQSAIAVDMEI